MLLTREEILASAAKLPTEEVEVPEWGGKVIVSAMSASTRDAWEQSLLSNKAERTLVGSRAKLAAVSIVDAEGKRMFGSDDIEALGKLSAESLDRICSVSSRLSGLNVQAKEEAKVNFTNARSAASTSS